MNLTEKVISIIEKNLEKKVDVKPESKLIDDLGIDSFERLMIVNAVEDEFNISIVEEDLSKIITVSDIVISLEQNLKK
jgi:acyl carrier protein